MKELTLSWVIVLLAGVAARADDGKPIVSQTRDITIPFVIEPANRGHIDHLTLLVSSDEGKTWKVAAKTTPELDHFDFSAPADGLYWFAVRTAQQDEGAPTSPSLKVRIETGDEPKVRGRQEAIDELDETRIQMELLELEVEADKKLLRESIPAVKKAEIQRALTRPARDGEANIDNLNKRAIEEVRADFVQKSKELSRAKRRVTELEERVGRTDAAKGRIRAIERIIGEILREVED
jgi:hypothetical protein